MKILQLTVRTERVFCKEVTREASTQNNQFCGNYIRSAITFAHINDFLEPERERDGQRDRETDRERRDGHRDRE